MRKRLFDKKVKKLNLVTSTIVSPSVTAAVLAATAGTIVTLDGTTAGIDTVNVSKAMNVTGLATITNLTVNTALKLPAAEYKSSGMEYGVFYFTGLSIFFSKSGEWVSASMA